MAKIHLECAVKQASNGNIIMTWERIFGTISVNICLGIFQCLATDLHSIKTIISVPTAHYETLQDKLAQLRDAREALDALREDHKDKRKREQEELDRQRQIQMAQKLEIMRQKKHVRWI